MPPELTWALAASGMVAVALIAGVLVTYNVLLRRSVLVDEAWGNVVAALVRRRDTLPALSQTLAAGMAHELTIERLQASTPQDALLVARDEQPPVLAMSGLARDVHRRLVSVEDDIQGSRLIFNRAVARYNRLVGVLPTALVARATGFATAPFFDAGTLLADADLTR